MLLNSNVAFGKYFMKNKTCGIAPIEVKILLCRCSAQKIAAKSGRNVDEITNISAPKKSEICFLKSAINLLSLRT